MEVCGQPFRNTLPPSYPIYQTPLWQGYQCSPLQRQHRRLVPNNSWGPTGISTPTHPLQACYWFPTKFSLGSVQSADMFRSASWLQGHHVLAELSGQVSGGSKGVINFQEVIKRFVIAFVTPSDAMNFFFFFTDSVMFLWLKKSYILNWGHSVFGRKTIFLEVCLSARYTKVPEVVFAPSTTKES